MANKKEKVPLEWVNVIFFVFLIVLAGIVFLLNGKMHSLLFLVLIWIIMAILMIILKAIVLSGDRDINNKEAGSIFLSSFISTLLIIGSTMLTANQIPIIGRAFENTVGYWFINNEELKTGLANVFENTSGNENINLIATQLFYDADIKKFYENLKIITQFNNIKPTDINLDTDKSVQSLQDIILNKNAKSHATIVCLAAIAAMYTSYMPIIKPWINI
jgi:uncharacterized membrane protein